MRRSLGWVVAAGVALTATSSATAGAGDPVGDALGVASCEQVQPPAPPSSPAAPRLGFGVTEAATSQANEPLIAALRGRLATFGVHAYVEAGAPWAVVDAHLARLRRLAEAGYVVTLDVNDINHYRPGATEPDPAYGGPQPPLDAYLAFLGHVVDLAGPWAAQIEIANEPNIPYPPTSDGAMQAPIAEVVLGVTLAKREVIRHRWPMKVGFNYVYSFDLPNDLWFWERLKAAATPEFLRDVDWMGLHTYPNPIGIDTPVNGAMDVIEHQALAMSRCWASWLGLPRSVPIDVTELGYATPKGAAEYPAQAAFWGRMLPLIDAEREAYGIRTVFAFYLRDSPGTSSFGLFDAAGNAKPAARTFADLAARFGDPVCHVRVRVRLPHAARDVVVSAGAHHVRWRIVHGLLLARAGGVPGQATRLVISGRARGHAFRRVRWVRCQPRK